MDLSDLEPAGRPIDHTPRPNASQTVAAQKRVIHLPEPRTPIPARQYRLPALAAGVIILLMIGMASYQLSAPSRPLQLPTAAPAQVFGTDPKTNPTAAPAPSTAPEPTIAPTVTLVPTEAALAVPVEPAQSGRGLTVDQSDAGEWTPPEPTAAIEPTAPPAEPTDTAWPTSAPAKPADFEKPDIRGTCLYTGCLGAKAVELERAQACHALYWQYGNADPETIAEPDLSAVRGCIWEGLYK